MALRSIVCTIIGHVDHGKSQIVEAITGLSIVEKEAGRITQCINAINVPFSLIEEIIGSYKQKIKIPGLLIIDTPGHASFTNLRKRGGSLADIAVLVIDVNEGIKPQTIECIEILRHNKTPFIIAANKIDLIQEKKNQLINEITNFIENHFINFRIIGMSAIQKTGIEEFNTQFIELVTNTSITESTDPIITNERHANKLLESINSLSNAKTNMHNQILDLAAFDLRQSLNSLGEITGEITPNDILDKIFSTFCVGK